MTSNEDLNKLFEAALGEKTAPSRFGTPEEMRKFSPVPMQKVQEQAVTQGSRFQAMATPSDAFQAAPAPKNAFQQAPANAFQAAPANAFQQPPAQSFHVAPSQGNQQQAPAFQAAYAPAPLQSTPVADPVQLDEKAVASLDSGLSAELGAILDAKVAREKRSKRRSLVLTLLFFVGLGGAATGWVVTNPERFEAMKQVIAEIKSAGDIKGMVAKYQVALDKIAVRGKQIDDATVAMGVDPASAADMADQGFDKEMRAMMGEDGGPTTASRNAKLVEKFKHVQESGSLIKKGDEPKAEEKTASVDE